MSNYNKKTIDDINVQGKKALVRCDFNVPIVDGKITDKTRIEATLPTIKKLLDKNAKVILCSHLGKAEKKLSLQPVAKELSKLLGKNVNFIKTEKVVDDAVKDFVNNMNEGEIILLENTRLRKEETECGENFAMELANLADVFVNDAFGTAHRAHASNVGVTKYIDNCVSGYLLKKEIDHLINAVEKPEKPFVAILGGAKISDKLKVIEKLLEKCDTLLIGGGMSYTFLKAMGYNVGKSLVDNDKLAYCKEMITKAKRRKKQLILPVDSLCAKDFPNPITNKKIETKRFKIADMDDNYMGLDIGEETIKLFMNHIKKAKTVIWNGPMGLFENEKFALGTYCIARSLTELKNATTIIGGGDSAAAINAFGLANKVTHVSTGGGATLEFLEGVELPGVTSLTDK